MAAERHKTRTLAAFSAACLPYAALGLPVYVTLPEFYASQIGVDLAIVGFVFMAVRLADIVVDPFLGLLIDRTSTRWGRYRVWMAAGAPVLMAAVFMLFMVERGAPASYLVTWLVLMYVGYSISLLAQISWAAVLSPDYDERSRIYGWWQAANVVGVVGVLLIPPVVQQFGFGDYVDAVRLQGLLIVLALPLTLLITFRFTPEPRIPANVTHGGVKDFVDLLRRPAARRLLSSDFLLGAARGIVGVLFFYFFEQARDFNRTETSTLLLIFFIAGLVGAPIWTRLAYKVGKHVALIVASLGFGGLLLATNLLLADAGFAVTAAGIFLTGLTFAASDLLLRAMMADISDEVRLDTGADRTGLLFSILVATSKCGYAVSVGTFALLQMSGFDASPGAVNSAQSLFWLQVMFIGVPTALFALAAAVLARYPLGAARHGEIRKALEARAATG